MWHRNSALRAGSMSEEIGQVAGHSCRWIRETLVHADPLEMAIGPRLVPRVAMCLMLPFRLLILILLWLVSRQVVVSAARFTVLLTEATRGRRCQPWTALVSSISNSHQTVLPTSALRTVFAKARMGA